jgi:hypothetical protein
MASTLTRGLVPSIAAIEILQAGGFRFRVDAMRADQETDRPPATKVEIIAGAVRQAKGTPR